MGGMYLQAGDLLRFRSLDGLLLLDFVVMMAGCVCSAMVFDVAVGLLVSVFKVCGKQRSQWDWHFKSRLPCAKYA
jgi:hypothetical protein